MAGCSACTCQWRIPRIHDDFISFFFISRSYVAQRFRTPQRYCCGRFNSIQLGGAVQNPRTAQAPLGQSSSTTSKGLGGIIGAFPVQGVGSNSYDYATECRIRGANGRCKPCQVSRATSVGSRNPYRRFHQVRCVWSMRAASCYITR